MNRQYEEEKVSSDKPALVSIYDKVVSVLDVALKMNSIADDKADRYFPSIPVSPCSDEKKTSGGMVEDILFTLENIEDRIRDTIAFINKV